MHHDNIEALRQEAVRITQLEINILGEMIKHEILSKPNPDSKVETTFDTVSAPKTIEVLEGEQHKLQNLDMVLAIVGTMKAGKSTTINAIVGTEILPNRNAPMTAIPTLIRHTKGQVEPKLVFDNYQPLNDLMQILHQQITKPNYAKAIEKLENSDRDLYSLVQKIRHREPINHQAVGAAAIFEFLKSVNDLVRIAPLFDIKFPFTDYDEIHELPIIEIEFTHLKEMEAGKGRLILLDTPGPNEAGQEHLRPMLQDQLKKASAVLAVMDYTQLKSEADQHIRDELRGIAETAKGRIYALVNKFDQKDHNSMNEKDVKDFITDLIDHQIQKEQIFPVSSKLAYLSNRARHALQIHGKLPIPKDEPWVNDFIEMANLDEDELTDISEIKKAAEKFWKRSNFSNPLENVIKMAFDNVALLALGSAADKCAENAEKIHNFLIFPQEALLQSTTALEKLVKEIQADIENVHHCQLKAEQTIETSEMSMSQGIEQTIKTLKENNKAEFEQYFKNGKVVESQILQDIEQRLKDERSLSSLFGEKLRAIALKEISNSKKAERQSSADVRTSMSPPQERHIPSNGIINFSDKKTEAEKFTQDIEDWINSKVNDTKSTIEAILEQALNALEDSYRKDVISSAQQTLDGLKHTLNKAGITGLKLDIPNINLLKLEINIAGLTSDVIQQESYTRTRYYDNDGAMAASKRFFGGLFGKTSWGRESYEAVEHEYKVDINKMQEITNQRLDDFFSNINLNIQHNIKKPIKESSDKFFAAFKEKVEHIRGDLIQSLKVSQQDEHTKKAYLAKITSIQQNMPFVTNLVQDTAALKKNLTAS